MPGKEDGFRGIARKIAHRARNGGGWVRHVQTFMIMTAAVTAQDWTFPRAQALPPYAFVVTDAVKARVRATGADIIDLGLGNPDRPTPPEIVAKLQAAATVTENHRYHPGRGLKPLRVAAAEWYARRYGV